MTRRQARIPTPLPAVLLLFALLLFALPAAAVAADPAADAGAAEDLWEDETEVTISDPLEGFNRGMFWVNDKLYFYLLKPVARVYRVVPEPARASVGRAFTNLGAPVRFANAALQLKPRKAGTVLGRFVVNSTIGLLGLFDPAAGMGLKPQDEDFGQTLGRYGVGSGFYLVLPVLGPTTLRDGVGGIADGFVDPISSPYYLKMKPLEEVGLKVYEQVNHLSLDRDTYESIKRDELDPYLFIRNVYLQHRAARVAD